MTPRIALVSCVKSKRAFASPAGDMYNSDLFRKMRAYAERHADTWFILSAEYGLLRPEQVIEPYERTLNNMPRAERVVWAERVQRQLLAALPPHADVIILAGEQYRENVVPFLEARGYKVAVPFAGLPFGRLLQALTNV